MIVSLRKLTSLAATGLVAALLAGPATAATITQWNFNVNQAGTNNSPLPSSGLGTAVMVGMTGNNPNGDFPAATGSSDAALPNLGWRVRGNTANGWSGTTSLLSGAQFNASTTGYTNIGISMDVFATDGSPRYAQLQLTTDGSNFTSFGPLLDFNTSNDNWANGISYDFSAVAGASDNPNFGFKLVSAFSPVEFTNANGLQAANTAFQRADAEDGVYTGGAGNYRFDMVTISGTVVPEPSTCVLIVCGFGLVAAAKRRRNA